MVRRKGFGTYFKSIDIFATDVSFKENGSESFGSIFGSMNSLIIVLIAALYGINKFVIMTNFEDTNFSEYTVIKGLTTDELS